MRTGGLGPCRLVLECVASRSTFSLLDLFPPKAGTLSLRFKEHKLDLEPRRPPGCSPCRQDGAGRVEAEATARQLWMPSALVSFLPMLSSWGSDEVASS